MKRFFPLFAAAILCGAACRAQQTGDKEADSVRVYELQQIEVTATRATKSTPVVHTDLSGNDILRNSYGADIPSLLAMTPSMIATNETGIGIGGTSIRLRGTDATRLNVTANGVPLNNPDSHSVYWYDTPDLISSVGDVQVQRGAGVSTNGTGVFGGSVNMTTAPLGTDFGGDASLSYGSYNTNKQAVHLRSGLMGGHWLVDARLSHIGSDGYIDRGATDLKSYMLQGAYYDGNTMVKLLSFGGKARTYLTYNGVSKEDMALYGRRYHTSGQYSTSDGPFVLADGSRVDYYDDQTDNYLQINNQLLVSHRFDDRWSLNFTGFYTYGYGYYKQYKDDAWILGYNNLQGPDQADLIREKIMRNHMGGFHTSANYSTGRFDLTFGGSWSYYTCPHWGELDWVDGMDSRDYAGRWYDNDVEKQDANIFAKARWEIARGLHLYADLQYRFVSYEAWGVNDNYDWNRLEMQPIDVDETYHFFNPHIGVNYTAADRHHLYASFSVAQKEPTRSDFTDRYMFSDDDAKPKSERLYDYEFGYQYSVPAFNAGVNFYYMKYKDQLVPTGMVNDGDDALNVNVPDSYRCGIELSALWKPLAWLSAGANATWSRNKIEHYVDLLKQSPTYGTDLGTMTIAYSPDWIAGGFLEFRHKGFEALFRTQYVGSQYFTNNENKALSLDSYCVSHLDLAYTLRTRSTGNVRFGLTLYNLFNAKYESNGYGYSYMYKGERVDEAFYFPQAPLHVLANVTVKF